MEGQRKCYVEGQHNTFHEEQTSNSGFSGVTSLDKLDVFLCACVCVDGISMWILVPMQGLGTLFCWVGYCQLRRGEVQVCVIQWLSCVSVHVNQFN